MTGVGSPFVSVVTPFYNTVEYLAECIESVLAQEYANWEYLLVDNSSTDGSTEVAASYAARDPRIRFVRYEAHLPQIPNYNRALRLISAESQYCKMVQADDYIAPTYLQETVRVAQADPRVGIVTSYYMNGSALHGMGLPYPIERFDGRDVGSRQLRDGISVFGSQTVPLFRSSIVRERTPFYSETALHADTEACFEILREWDLGFVHQVLAYMRAHGDSITSGIMSFNPDLLDRLIQIERYGSFCLTATELRALRHRQWGAYRRYLGASWLRRREPMFWKHHQDGLASIGQSLPRLALPWYALRAVVAFAAHRVCGLF
jgi:glycosyltransferase involved in cell wall biosynthesis